MTHVEQLTAATARAADTTRPAAERRWWAAHVAYLQALPAHRAAYRALRDDALALGIDYATFDAAARAEIDEDLAGDDAGEWVRAAKAVLAGLAPEPECEPHDWEERAWRRHLWNRACDHALNAPAW